MNVLAILYVILANANIRHRIQKEGCSRLDNEDVRIARAVRGDADALAALLREHYPFVMNYLLKVTMNRPLAEDIAQETMIRAIESIAAFRRDSKFSTWLVAIASRLVIDAARRRKRERRWRQDEYAARSLRYETLQAQGEWPAAMDALGRLPPGVRMAILLKHYYGYGYDEIGAMMGIPAGTVKSRVHNGINELRKELGDDA